MNKFCQKCGKEVNENAAVCIHCGVILNRERNAPNPGLALGITSMVLGILGIFFILVPFMGILLALIGLILGTISKKTSSEAGMPYGMATAGIVCSTVTLAATILITVACICPTFLWNATFIDTLIKNMSLA